MRFVDTNVLLYAVSKLPADAEKAATALKLLNEFDLALSVQVLQEFYVQAVRPTKIDKLSHEQAAGMIEAWLRFPVQEMTVDILRAALASSRRFRVPYWDAAIVEAARTMDCGMILSEDLNDGQDYDGVRVLNPFRVKRTRPRPSR